MSQHNTRFYFALCPFALWFPLLFATPFFLTLQNVDDFQLSLLPLTAGLLLITALASVFTYVALNMLSSPAKRRASYILIAFALVLAIQGNVVHDLFDYGQFNGEEVNWRTYGWAFWFELIAFISAPPLIYAVLLKVKNGLTFVPLIPILSSAMIVVLALTNFQPPVAQPTSDELIDDAVFHFSSQRNLIHLIPDGLQADIVKEVLEENPRLKDKFRGFTFFDNHLGQFQATAPSVPTIYNGAIYDLSEGYSYGQVQDKMDRLAYQNILLENGYRLDFVSIVAPYCTSGAASCVVRGFNDLRSYGYYATNTIRTLKLIADLSLFRHVPMFLKEQIYRDGNWLISGTDINGASAHPDPVIREWIENMVVTNDGRKYKSYHYIGTHVPPQWDAECNFRPELERVRENYIEQTYCILNGISSFIAALEANDIYDRTAIIITADHGTNTAANDVSQNTGSVLFHPRFIGHARPAFMVKELNNRDPLRYSIKPTTMIDIAPTSLDLVELEGQYEGTSGLADNHVNTTQARSYHRYRSDAFWSGDPVAFSEYQLLGNVRGSGWSITGLHNFGVAPNSYAGRSRNTIVDYSAGIYLSDEDEPWVYGSEFAFLISRPDGDFEYLGIDFRSLNYSEGRSFRININNRGSGEIVVLNSSDGLGATLSVPILDFELIEDNNFVCVQLENADRESNDSPQPMNVIVDGIEFR